MERTGHITPESLMSLEAYAKWRKLHKTEVMALRQQRTVTLNEHLRVQFESEITIRYQIQEMLRIEKVFEEAGIQQEIDAYVPLVPDGHNWKATVMLAYPDVDQRKQALAQLIGVEDRLFVQIDGHAPVYAIADEDLDRETELKTSAVHFVRFELTPAMCAAVASGAAATLGCDHAHYNAAVAIAPDTLQSLITDLQ